MLAVACLILPAILGRCLDLKLSCSEATFASDMAFLAGESLMVYKTAYLLMLL